MRLIVIVLSIVLNVMLYSGGRDVGGLSWWQTFALLAVLNGIAILLHELGHAWAFRHVGGSVQKIAVLFWAYDVRKKRLSMNARLLGSDVGGYVVGRYAPTGPTAKALIIVAAAGPVANLVSGAMALIAAVMFGRQGADVGGPIAQITPGVISGTGVPAGLPSDAGIAAAFAHAESAAQAAALLNLAYTSVLLFGVLSLGLALLNLIPFRGSDGETIARGMKLWRMMVGKTARN